jgi:bacillithiol system protein YtxJ
LCAQLIQRFNQPSIPVLGRGGFDSDIVVSVAAESSGSQEQTPLNPEIQPITSRSELDAALAEPRAVLFKHSTRCWVSSRSLAEVEEFLADSAEVPVYLIDVIADRALSREVAERLDVWHQSPQAILIEDGRVVWHASHSQVTAQALAEATASGTDAAAEAASGGV